MKVNEFAKKLGISKSKIRYYDRIGLTNSSRTKNNYRDFQQEDALEVYHTQMLRSFDMSIEESFGAKDKSLSDLQQWVKERQLNLSDYIRDQEMKLHRLVEMQHYFDSIREDVNKVTIQQVGDSYNVFPFSESGEGIQILAESMPYSYIAVKIKKESLVEKRDVVEVELGLGMLKVNKEKLGIDFDSRVKMSKGGEKLSFLIEAEDLMTLKREALEPFLNELEKRGIAIQEDLIGRIFMSYQKDGKLTHGIGIGYLVK